MSSDRLNAPSIETTTVGAGSLVETRFIPQRYEPNYAYPLLVLFHARGGDEQQMVRSMPAMSWRNYVGLSLRGPEPVVRRGCPDGFGWGPPSPGPTATARGAPTALPEAEIVRRRLRGVARPPRPARGQGLRRDPPDPPVASRPLRADLPRRHAARGRRSPTGSA